MRKTALGFVVLFFGKCALGPLTAGAVENAEPTVTLAATVGVTDETAAKPGVVTVSRSGDLSAALSVDLEIKGTGKPGVDYHEIPHSLTIPAGESSAAITITAFGNFEKNATRTVIVELKRGSHYQNGQPESATVKINDSPPELFVAMLRPAPDAPESTAYGTATLFLAPDRSRTLVTVGHANLTSPLVSSHLKLGTPGHEGSYLINFPAGQNVTF